MRARVLRCLLLAVFLGGCVMQGAKEANTWINSLQTGMTVDEVRSSKPDHVTIHWEHPTRNGMSIEYEVSYEDRSDFAPTPYYLVFRDGKYTGYGGRN